MVVSVSVRKLETYQYTFGTEVFNSGKQMATNQEERVQGAKVRVPLLAVKFKLSCGLVRGLLLPNKEKQWELLPVFQQPLAPRLVTGRDFIFQPNWGKT